MQLPTCTYRVRKPIRRRSCWPSPAKLRLAIPNLRSNCDRHFGQMWAEIERTWAEIGPTSTDVWPTSTKSGPHAAKFGSMFRADVDQFRAEPGQVRTDVDQNRACFDEAWTNGGGAHGWRPADAVGG